MNKEDYLRKKGLLPPAEFGGSIWIVESGEDGVTLTEHTVWDVVVGDYYYEYRKREDANPYIKNPYLKNIFISPLSDASLNADENTDIPDYRDSLGYCAPGDPLIPHGIYGFLVKKDAEAKVEKEKLWMDRYYHPKKYIEQNVHNNSIAFRQWLDDKKINYKPNGHFTTIIGDIDKFQLGVEFGRYWEANKDKN